MDRSASRYLCYSSHRQPGLFLLFIFLLQFFVLSLILIRQPGVTKIHFGFFVLIVYNFFLLVVKTFPTPKGERGSYFLEWVFVWRQFNLKQDLLNKFYFFFTFTFGNKCHFYFHFAFNESHSLRIISPEMRLVPLSDFPFGSQCPPEEIEVREIFSMWILTGCVLQGV